MLKGISVKIFFGQNRLKKKYFVVSTQQHHFNDKSSGNIG